MEIAWTPKMSVYNETIDHQHEKLLCQIEDLRKELTNIDIGPIRETIDFFDKYVKEHLNYEEEYMKKHNYPNFKKHKDIHDTFRKYFENFKQEFREAYSSKYFSAGDIKELLIEAERFLANWWINHILKKDHEYAEYIKSHPS